MDMHNTFRVIIPLILVLSILAAGCTQQTASVPAAPPATPSPASLPAVTAQPALPALPAATTTASCSLEPGPTAQVPEDESVSITVSRNTDTETPTISARLNGGLGLGQVERMTMTVVRSDCVTEQDLRDAPDEGYTLTLMGTRKTDRVIVTLTMDSGKEYTVIDKDYPFPGNF